MQNKALNLHLCFNRYLSAPTSFHSSYSSKPLSPRLNVIVTSQFFLISLIDMPGLSMPNFREMADVVRRVGIYGPRDYLSIVEETIKFWEIEKFTGLNKLAKKAQEKILSIPKRLEKVAEYVEKRNTSKTFSFEFIYNRIIAFE